MLKKINILFEKIWFPISFKFVTFIAFCGLIFIGLSAHTDNLILSGQLYRTNLTNVFVWDTWWPLIILSAIVFGRVWCMICPVELITSFSSRIGFKLKRPRWLLSGWVIPIFYAIIVIIGVTLLEIDFKPVYTAWYLLIIVGISIISGLIFEKNTFCRYICPVGFLLYVFSKVAIWGWRVKSKPVCKACPDKSCISSKYNYQLNYKSCGVDLVPAELNDNKHCILCSGCLKTCKTYKTSANTSRPNPALVKLGFANDIMQIKPFLITEWIFLYFLTAHLIDEITEFKLITTLKNMIFPVSFSSYLNIKEGLGKNLIATGFLFFLLPIILWGLPYLVILSARIKMSVSKYLKNLSFVFLPLIISLFVGLIFMEVAVRVPYYKYIVADPIGIRTMQGILTHQILVAKLPTWTQWIFLFILVASLIAGIYLSFKVIKQFVLKFRLQKHATTLYASIFVFVLTFFAVVLLYHGFK
ncbi:MAG: 4Fe-4S binding protein [Bacteroidia bacterium]|nr:4Fe-4S binding protein [Bacteroidia bacterium]